MYPTSYEVKADRSSHLMMYKPPSRAHNFRLFSYDSGISFERNTLSMPRAVSSVLFLCSIHGPKIKGIEQLWPRLGFQFWMVSGICRTPLYATDEMLTYKNKLMHKFNLGHE